MIGYMLPALRLIGTVYAAGVVNITNPRLPDSIKQTDNLALSLYPIQYFSTMVVNAPQV